MKKILSIIYKFLKGTLLVLYKFIRGVIRLVFNLLVSLFVYVTIKLSGEKDKGVTRRKIRRVKFLTNVKLFFWKYMPYAAKFLGKDKYLEDLNRRLGNGM